MYASHKAEKRALRDAYRQSCNRFKKRPEKSALPEAEKARRREQTKRQQAFIPTRVVSGIGKPRWRRGKAT